MPFVLFHNLFPQIAEDETRTIKLMEESELGLPVGDYSFLEMFCNEPGCDCRRVLFSVVTDPRPDAILAVVNWGWEKEKFYAKWLSEDNPALIKEMRGPSLNMASPQSELAPAILALTERVLLRDPQYTDRIKRHYKMFREQIEGDACSKVIPLPIRNPRLVRNSSKREKALKVRNPIPTNHPAWLDEIAEAYIDARDAITFGHSVGQLISERDLHYMAPIVCLKFRGLKQSEKLLVKATEAALSSYVASLDLEVGTVLAIPQMAFAFCYLAAHLGVGLMKEEEVDVLMEFLELEKQVLIDKTS